MQADRGGQLAACERAQIAHAAVQILDLALDQRVGDGAERIPALAHTVNEEAGARRVLAHVLAILVAEIAALPRASAALLIERAIHRADVEAEAAALDDFGLKAMRCAPDQHVRPDDGAAIFIE